MAPRSSCEWTILHAAPPHLTVTFKALATVYLHSISATHSEVRCHCSANEAPGEAWRQTRTNEKPYCITVLYYCRKCNILDTKKTAHIKNATKILHFTALLSNAVFLSHTAVSSFIRELISWSTNILVLFPTALGNLEKQGCGLVHSGLLL